MNKLVSALVIGGVFGLGIAISGMANPAKILNFFDVAGAWDPSLAFVMGGGLAVAFVGYRLIFARRKAPVFESCVRACRRGGGSIASWSAAPRCSASAGALPASVRAARSRHSASAIRETPIFVAAMVAGIVIARAIRILLPRPAAA